MALRLERWSGAKHDESACYNGPVTEPHFKPDLDRPNPVTRARFQRQVWLEIYLPFGVGLLLLAAVSYALWAGGWGTASAWADAALALLLIPTLVVGLVALVLIAGAAYGVWELTRKIPGPARRLHQFASRVEASARQAMDLAAEPALRGGAVRAALRELVDGLRSMLRGW